MVVGITTLIISCTKRCAISVFNLLCADDIAKVAGVVAMFLIGRCYCHVADVIATNCVLLIWQMLLRKFN